MKKIEIKYTAIFGRVLGLLVVTVFALVVMLASGTKVFNGNGKPAAEPAPSPAPTSRAAVTIRQIDPDAPETIQIVENYTGMIEPYERYRMSFEIGGRLEALGVREVDAQGNPVAGGSPKTLDAGDRVHQGQVLAVLDRRALLARKQEAQARREEAESDLERKRALAQRSPGIVSEEEMQSLITALEIAQAMDELAEKNLEDAVLLSPCDGVITSREVNAGESVNPHQLIYEILDVDRLRLVVGVPQSRLFLLTREQDGIHQDRLTADDMWDAEETFLPPDSATFPTSVRLLQQLRPGDDPVDVEGFIYRISEDDDQNTGLFPVEILLDNSDHQLRPGQLARAAILVEEVTGYRVPLATALHRNGKTYVFTVDGVEDEIEYLGWEVGKGTDYTARMVELTQWFEQGQHLVLPVPADSSSSDSHPLAGIQNIVVRGQHRLVDNRPVRLVQDTGEASATSPIPATSAEQEASLRSAEAMP